MKNKQINPRYYAIDLVNKSQQYLNQQKKKCLSQSKLQKKYDNDPTERQPRQNPNEQVETLLNLFQEQGLDSVNGLMRFIQLFQESKTRQSTENKENCLDEMGKSYTALFKRRNKPHQGKGHSQEHIKRNRYQNDESQQYDVQNKAVQQNLQRVNIVKCRGQFTKPSIVNKTEQEPSKSRLSIMIQNAQSGLHLLSDKINNFSNSSKDIKNNNFSCGSRDLHTISSKDRFASSSQHQPFFETSETRDSFLPTDDTHEYLYESSSNPLQEQLKELRIRQDQDKEFLIKQIKTLSDQNQNRDILFQTLQRDMQKVQLTISQIQTKKRQKKLVQQFGNQNMSPKSNNSTTPRPNSSFKKSCYPDQSQDLNIYTFNISSPSKPNSKKQALEVQSQPCNDYHQQSDLREFIIHTQSQQILKRSQKKE